VTPATPSESALEQEAQLTKVYKLAEHLLTPFDRNELILETLDEGNNIHIGEIKNG
jgi:hypothetical protein